MTITKTTLANGHTLWSLDFGGNRIGEYIEIDVAPPKGPGNLTSNLKEDRDDHMPEEADEMGPCESNEAHAAIDGFESLILALACEGHDLSAMAESIETAYQSICNEYGE